jgi:hypothetical protein
MQQQRQPIAFAGLEDLDFEPVGRNHEAVRSQQSFRRNTHAQFLCPSRWPYHRSEPIGAELLCREQKGVEPQAEDELGVKLHFQPIGWASKRFGKQARGGSARFIGTPRHPVQTNYRPQCELFAQLQAKRLTLGDCPR